MAAAAMVDSNFYDNVKEIVIMGGYTEDYPLSIPTLPDLFNFNLSAETTCNYQ